MKNEPLRPNRRKMLSVMAAAVFLVSCPAIASATDLSGCWNGYWQSCTTGHEGPLSAVFSKVSGDRYQVTFSGRFFKVFPFRYTVTLNVTHDDGRTVTLAGNSYLGRLFGTFTYRAGATATNFNANYSSRRDSGKFVLHRSTQASSVN
ncbi:MAG TPA: hypothetical protein VHY91_02140 [Pirellulales bacterium]|nr:hypothetical protein [Pirellulales bacterium]